MDRSHGFLEEAVKEITARPGQSANGIAKRLLADGRAVWPRQWDHWWLRFTNTTVGRQCGVSGGTDTFRCRTRKQTREARPSPSQLALHVEELTTGLRRRIALSSLMPWPYYRQFDSRRDVVLWLVRKDHGPRIGAFREWNLCDWKRPTRRWPLRGGCARKRHVSKYDGAIELKRTRARQSSNCYSCGRAINRRRRAAIVGVGQQTDRSTITPFA